MVKEVETIKPEKASFPKCIFFIVLNEFCERFSFYGLRTILIIYLTQFIKMNDNSATALFHGFTMLCYFTPILGAILADGYIGLYRTIVSVSFIYLIGEIILTITAMKPLGAPNIIGPSIGLVLIALGTGGIKPCVSAFGANQFSANQQKYLVTFFSLFYFSINLGSVISTIVTPMLRSDVKCFDTECYPLAFGVPTALMGISIALIIIGRPFFKVDQVKKDENIFKKVICCIFYGITKKFRHSNEHKSHWLDHASDKYPQEFINDVKKFIRVIIMFIPVPVFWALFDQQGSRWTLQAQKLNQQVTDTFSIKADQIQSINPVLILILIPVFNWIVYPLMDKCNLFKAPLKRMTLGMLFAAIAFIVSALLEFKIQSEFVHDNPTNLAKIINLTPCVLNVPGVVVIEPYLIKKVPLNQFNGTLECEYFNKTFNFEENLTKNLVISIDETTMDVKLTHFESLIEHQPIGSSEIRFLKVDDDNTEARLDTSLTSFRNIKLDFNSSSTQEVTYKRIEPDEYSLVISDYKSNKTIDRSIKLNNGARETYVIFYRNSTIDTIRVTDLVEYKISFAYQFIQYVIITIAEILFSVNGLSFAYSEAPESMKSILQAAWLLTVAFGNLIVLVIAEADLLHNQAYEYLLFAGLMFATMIVFAIMTYFYQSNDKKNETEKQDKALFKIEPNDDLSSSVQLVKMSMIDTTNENSIKY